MTTAQAAPYVFTDLGTLGGVDSYGYGINDSGQVVGTSSTGVDGMLHATLWNGSTALDLGTLGGNTSHANGINDKGQIIGFSDGPGANDVMSATLWNGTALAPLGTPAGSIGGYGRAINSSGHVVGGSLAVGYLGYRATRWDAATPIYLGTTGGSYSNASAINNAGAVAGYGNTEGDAAWHAVRWTDSGATDLGALKGFDNSYGLGINEANQVVGYSDRSTDVQTRATLWNGTDAVALDGLDGSDGSAIAEDINNAGQIVGFGLAGDGYQHAILWSAPIPTDLNTFLDDRTANAGWYLHDAVAINDRGWITGTAMNSQTGQTHAYLLSISTVAEPGSFGLLLLGLSCVGLRSRASRSSSASRQPTPRKRAPNPSRFGAIS